MLENKGTKIPRNSAKFSVVEIRTKTPWPSARLSVAETKTEINRDKEIK